MTDEESKATTEDIAEKLASRIVTGKKILDIAEDQIINSLRIDGKTLKEWAKELMVEVPSDNDDIHALEIASTDIANATQRAEYILAIFELQAHAATNFHEEGFARKYVLEMQNQGNGKIAADKLRQLALIDPKVDSSLAASQTAMVIVDYFKRIVRGLEEARKGLENRTRLLGLRLKFIPEQD